MGRVIMMAAVVFVVTGCAASATEGLIVDRKGVDPGRYRQDLAECGVYADEVQAGRKIAGRTAAGAVVGGAVGAVADGEDGAEKGAGIGAVVGAARGTSDTLRERQRVVRNCMRGRGYRVLN